MNRIETTTRTATLDLNYGLTDRLGIQVAIPYKHVESDAQIGGLTPVPYSERGLGDIRASLKYNVLPTLCSMVVLGVGVDFPTGSYGRFAQGNTLAESTLQIGRGNFGIVTMIYQTYELIPHRVNQFASASYRYNRDPTDPEVIWSINDGDAKGDDGINCPTPQTGGSVTILHNSHIGPGGTLPEIHKEICFGAGGRGHHSATFTRETGLPLSTYITSEHDGAVIVIDNNPNNVGTYLSVIARLDMCDGTKQVCDTDVGTPNTAGTHGIYFSSSTNKVYVHNEGYEQLAVIDPANGNAVTRLDIGPYGGLRLSGNGRFLVMRRTDTASDPNHVIGKIRVLDLAATPIGIADFDVQDVRPQTIRMSANGTKLFLTQSNSLTGLTTNQQTALKQDVLQVFDMTGLPATLPAPAEITLEKSNGRSVELYEKNGALVSILVSNTDDDSLSIINAATNVVSTIPISGNPGAIFIFEKGAVAANP